MSHIDPIDDFRIEEETKLRKQLAALNKDNLQQYFAGVNGILDELNTKRRDLEAEERLRAESLADSLKWCGSARDELKALRANVVKELEQHKADKSTVLEKLKSQAPQVLSQITRLSDDRTRLKQLKFAQFIDEHVRKINYALDGQEYSDMCSFYDNICIEVEQIPAGCIDGYQRRMHTLNEALVPSLRAQLTALYERIRFPFEDSVNYRALATPLGAIIAILRCLREVYFQLGKDESKVIQLVIEPFETRFAYHFTGNKPTNNETKPEWFFAQTLTWIGANSEFFEAHIQTLFDEWGISQAADELFAERLIICVRDKLRGLLACQPTLDDKQRFAHLLDETIKFSNELHDMFGKHTSIPEVMALYVEPRLLDEWIELERDVIAVGVDEILDDEAAFDNRFDEIENVDSLMVPNVAETFVVLMQSMSERYLALRDSRLQTRFLKHQLIIVDEFLSRIARMLHEIEAPWDSPYPQLMNAIWFIAIVLNEWSINSEYISLNAVETEQPLSRGTFDESADLYQHEWRKRARTLVNAYRDVLEYTIKPYADEKWFQMNLPKPVDVTPSLGKFINATNERIAWLREHISEDSRLTLFRLVNEELWSCLFDTIVRRTAFTSRGAAQMLYDVQSALIPLLQHSFVPRESIIQPDSGLKFFSVAKSVVSGLTILDKHPYQLFNEMMKSIKFQKCCEVVNCLKVLALPSATAILLKDEIMRTPESMTAELLEPLKIDNIGREKLLHLFEQRCDMNKI